MTWCGWKIQENCHVLVKQFHGYSPSKTLSCREINCVSRDVKWCFNASSGIKGLLWVTKCCYLNYKNRSMFLIFELTWPVVTLVMKECICHFVIWQIHPFISKGTLYFHKLHLSTQKSLSSSNSFNLFYITINFNNDRLCHLTWKWVKVPYIGLDQ